MGVKYAKTLECVDVARDALDIWARWLKAESSPLGGLGWGDAVLHERLDYGYPSSSENATAELVEALLCDVKRLSAVAWRMLYLCYYCEQSTRQAADAMNLSHSRARELKLAGEIMLATKIQDFPDLQKSLNSEVDCAHRKC